MTNDLSVTCSGEGEALILLHGWGMNASVFGPLCEILNRHNRIYRVDLPGYGGSRWNTALSFEDQAAQIATQIPRGILIGWSMGGLYATEMLRQNPDQFEGLILISSNPCFVQRPDWSCAVKQAVFDDFARDLDKGWAATIRRFLSLQMHGHKNARQLIRDLMVQIQEAGEPDVQALKFGLDLLKNIDARPILADCEIPIQMILGQHDALIPSSLAKEIGKVNERIQVESIATAAHAPILSHTEQIASMIVRDKTG
ncbi:MAG: pimeloyl-ACP methyl ester esterase BioH [Proteobacteria bacterium]|nr:pimeloyl-ACP methyl ester esterase BioH [Pseudomonadota bacterium]